MATKLVESGSVTYRELLERILHFVPQRQRLGSCALVNSVWRAAADAATTDISMSLYGVPEGCFNNWLQQRANKQAIRSMHLREGDSEGLIIPVLQLPSLQHLNLNNTEWSATLDSPQQPAVGARSQLLPLRVLTTLTCLKLGGASLVLAELQYLPHLTGLEELALDFDEAIPANFAGALAQMQSVTRLELSSPVGRVSPFSLLDGTRALTNLQALKAHSLNSRRPAHCTALLPPSLTQLVMEDCSPLPQLAHLTALQTLKLSLVTLHSASGTKQCAAFSSLTNLRRLELYAVKRGVRNSDVEEDTTWLSPQEAAALTSSSHLTALHLTQTEGHCTIYKVTLPPKDVANMFAHATQGWLLNMCELSVSLSRQATAREFAQACGCLVSCCPKLRTLTLDLDTTDSERSAGETVACPEQPSWLTGGLQRLAGLSGSLQTLKLYCDNHPRDFAVWFQPEDWRALAALTSLTSLHVACSTPAVPDLLRLTACRRLQELILDISDPVCPGHAASQLFIEATPGAAPDVWERLLLLLNV